RPLRGISLPAVARLEESGVGPSRGDAAAALVAADFHRGDRAEGIDADHDAAVVEQRPAGIALVDAGVVLDDRADLVFLAGAALDNLADDALGHGRAREGGVGLDGAVGESGKADRPDLLALARILQRQRARERQRRAL